MIKLRVYRNENLICICCFWKQKNWLNCAVTWNFCRNKFPGLKIFIYYFKWSEFKGKCKHAYCLFLLLCQIKVLRNFLMKLFIHSSDVTISLKTFSTNNCNVELVNLQIYNEHYVRAAHVKNPDPNKYITYTDHKIKTDKVYATVSYVFVILTERNLRIACRVKIW